MTDDEDLERVLRLFGPPGPERAALIERLDEHRRLLGDRAYDRAFRSGMDRVDAKAQWAMRPLLTRREKAAAERAKRPMVSS